ncbi:MAG: hypothetical protein GX994_05685 [Firmicutes bacterium]|nr:hypothetical protein [Bacillota bacterium]
MTTDDFTRILSELKIWKRGSERTPHKPLLLLYALSRVDRKEARLNSYENTKKYLRSY